MTVATVAGLPAGSDYAVGNFRGSPLREFIFYKPGENNLTVRPVEEPAPGQVPVWQGPELRPGPAGAAGGCARRERRRRSCSSSSARAKRPGCLISTATKAPALVQSLAATNDAVHLRGQHAGRLHRLFAARRRQVLHALPDLQGGRRDLRRRPVRQPGLPGRQRQHHHPGHLCADRGQARP